jgi:hypothetical protein
MLKPNENFTPVSVNGMYVVVVVVVVFCVCFVRFLLQTSDVCCRTVSRENSQMLQHNDIIVIGNKAFRFLYSTISFSIQ